MLTRPASVTLLCALVLPLAPQAAWADADEAVVRAIDTHARPLRSTSPSGDLRDLRALGQMVNGATVVGLGEATHNSREFFTMKHRVFRYLVREKGFRAFSQEVHVAAGLRINDYVMHGKGDIRQIMNEEFQSGTRLWNTGEYLALFQWMRSYNARHSQKLQYVGNDVDYPGLELFLRVEAYVRERHPESLPTLNRLYRGLRPTVDMDTWWREYPQKPLGERKTLAAQAYQVVDLLRRHDSDSTIVQYARFIAQAATLHSYDLADHSELLAALKHREQAMADNTIWWNHRTGGRTLLSAHNGHVAYGISPPPYPYARQGELLRRQLGHRYVSVGFTFHHGTFNAFAPGTNDLRPVTVGPAEEGTNEFTLDKARYRDYLLDMRTVPGVARKWLAQARPTRDIGAEWPDEPREIALGTLYDVLVHLHEVKAATTL